MKTVTAVRRSDAEVHPYTEDEAPAATDRHGYLKGQVKVANTEIRYIKACFAASDFELVEGHNFRTRVTETQHKRLNRERFDALIAKHGLADQLAACYDVTTSKAIRTLPMQEEKKASAASARRQFESGAAMTA